MTAADPAAQKQGQSPVSAQTPVAQTKDAVPNSAPDPPISSNTGATAGIPASVPPQPPATPKVSVPVSAAPVHPQSLKPKSTSKSPASSSQTPKKVASAATSSASAPVSAPKAASAAGSAVVTAATPATTAATPAAATPKKRSTPKSKSTSSSKEKTTPKAAKEKPTAATPKEKSATKTTKKKRKPATPSDTTATKKKKTTPKKNLKAAAAPTAPDFVPPKSVLIIDNGGDTLKYGWARLDASEPEDQEPKIIPNATARLQHQWTVLVGDEMAKVKNPNSLQSVTRSTERGLVVDLGNQIQVWKRILDLEGVAVSMHSEAARSLGWKMPKQKSNAAATNKPVKPPHAVAVFLLLPPHCPRLLLDQFVQVWLEDFGVSCVGFGVSPVMAAQHQNVSCVVDIGWSATHVVPTFRGKALEPIRRMPLGGRHMVNMLKYFMSYRQYNLMDQEQILRSVLEQLGYVSLDVVKELAVARQLPSGRRPYDRDFVLPDYQKTFQGQIRLPWALIRDQERALAKADEVNDEDEGDDDEEDEDFIGDDAEDEDDIDMDDDGGGDDENEDTHVVEEDGNDSEEETAEELRLRVLRERAEEERRKREQAEEEQFLRVSVERFTIPEILFRPQDAGLPPDLDGLAQTVAKTIRACPEIYRPALYQNIHVTGGLSQLPNLKERLERELRCLVPDEYDLRIALSTPSIGQAWFGAKKFVQSHPIKEWSVSREEHSAASKQKEKSYTRLLAANNGLMV